MEGGFLLNVLSSAWNSWYIFNPLFTIFRPIKSTLYSVFYIFEITIYKIKRWAVFMKTGLPFVLMELFQLESLTLNQEREKLIQSCENGVYIKMWNFTLEDFDLICNFTFWHTAITQGCWRRKTCDLKSPPPIPTHPSNHPRVKGKGPLPQAYTQAKTPTTIPLASSTKMTPTYTIFTIFFCYQVALQG